MSTETMESGAGGQEGSVAESMRGAIERLHESATVDRVYGEPITSEGKTVVPVARIAYGFGGGFGSGTETEGETNEGGGAGGGVVSRPIGALEITGESTRFVRFDDRRRTALAVGLGVVLGVLLGRR